MQSWRTFSHFESFGRVDVYRAVGYLTGASDPISRNVHSPLTNNHSRKVSCHRLATDPYQPPCGQQSFFPAGGRKSFSRIAPFFVSSLFLYCYPLRLYLMKKERRICALRSSRRPVQISASISQIRLSLTAHSCPPISYQPPSSFPTWLYYLQRNVKD